MKKKLVILTSILFFVGLAFAAAPFISSLNPTVRSVHESLHIPIGELAKGKYFIKDLPHSRLFVLNAYDSGVRVYLVPMQRERVQMPDLAWFRVGGFCNTFEPEMDDGKLKPGGVFRCMDKNLNKWQEQEWLWSYEGKNLGKYTEDMYVPRHLVKNNQLILLGARE